MSTLTMTRAGEFTIRVAGPSHCGAVRGGSNLVVKYTMRAVCDARVDSRGFLFDQLTVQNFFGSLKKTDLSCEKLTMQCCHKLIKLVLAENPKCLIHEMELTLSPAPFMASMNYKFQPDQGLTRTPARVY